MALKNTTVYAINRWLKTSHWNEHMVTRESWTIECNSIPWRILLLAWQCQFFLQVDIGFSFGLRVCQVLGIWVEFGKVFMSLYCTASSVAERQRCLVILSVSYALWYSVVPISFCLISARFLVVIYLLFVCSSFSSLHYSTSCNCLEIVTELQIFY